MSKIKVEKATDEKLKALKVDQWGEWGCGVSRFDWSYDSTETCYLTEGQVTVITTSGEKTTFGAGDIVLFPKGLSCTWDVTTPVKKRFKFD